MTQKEFVKWVKDEITMSGSINISLTDAEYKRLVERELQGVYQINPMAVRKEYCILPAELFWTEEFRRNRKIQFPKCVLSVGRFEEMCRRHMWLGMSDPDFGFNKTFMADMWLGGMLNLDSVMFRTILMSVWDLLKNFNLIDIRHTWNEVDHTMLVTGHTPRTSVYCEVFVKVADTELFDDYYVRKYIAAACKQNVAKMIGTFTTTLLSGVQINTNLYTEEANKDIEDCKTYWKTLMDADMFFLTTP